MCYPQSFCPAGKRFTETVKDCAKCNVGKYQDENQLAEADCKTCGNGRFAASSDAKCTDCDAGQYRVQISKATVQSSRNYGSLNHGCQFCQAGREFNTKATVCKVCTPGQYQTDNQNDNATCQGCSAGFASGGTTQECDECPRGYFQNLLSQVTCVKCETGRYQKHAQATECKLCPVGWYPDRGIDCKRCSSGKYQPQAGQAECKLCSSGKFSKQAGDTILTGCDDCPSDKYSPSDGAGECEECINNLTLACALVVNGENVSCAGCQGCMVGEYINPLASNKNSKEEDCLPCERGKYSNVMNQQSCTSCPAGWQVNKTKMKKCEPCQPGYYDIGRSNNMTCIACAQGLYQEESEQMTCKSCPEGTYGKDKALVDSVLCSPCPVGRYNTEVAGVNKDACTACDGGKYSSEAGLGLNWKGCKECPSGRYGTESGLSICKFCEPGQTQPNLGQLECLDCDAGTYYNQSTNVCKKCASGQSQAMPGQTSCRACRAGLYQDSKGQEVCLKCAANKYSEVQASMPLTSCITCPHGWSSSHPGQKSCVKCSKGTYSVAAGADCNACPQGFVSQEPGQKACARCEQGFFQPNTKGITCLECGTGFFSFDPVETGNFSTCTDCPGGYYNDKEGQSICLLCPMGWTTNIRSPVCSACKPGQYGVDAAAAAAAPAPGCQSCPAGFSQQSETNTMCDLCAAGMFSMVGRPSCTRCPAGWSSLPEENQRSSCIACPSGYQSSASSADCAVCPAGFASASQSETCFQCEVGQYQNDSAADACIRCETSDRLYQDEVNATSCKQCPIGKFVSLGRNSVTCQKQEEIVEGLTNAPVNLNILVLKRSDQQDVVHQQGSRLRFSWTWTRQDVKPDMFVLTYAVPTGGDMSCSDTNVQYSAGKLITLHTNETTIDIDMDVYGWCHPLSKATVHAVIQGKPGFGAVFVTQWRSARLCRDTKYLEVDSKDPADWVCRACPFGASCAGAITWSGVRAKFGYFRYAIDVDNDEVSAEENKVQRRRQRRTASLDVGRADSSSIKNLNVTFVPCKFPPACLGAPNNDLKGKYLSSYIINASDTNATDPATMDLPEMCNVNEGYQMYCNGSTTSQPMVMCRVCGTCRRGFSRGIGGASYRCSKCPESSDMTFFLLILALLSLLMIIVVLVLNAMADAAKDLASDALQKIIVNYLQAAAIALSFPLQWPEMLVTFFNMQGAISTVGEFIVNPDCQLSWMTPASIFYVKLAAFACLPFAMILVSYIWWRVVAHCIRKVPWSTASEETEAAAAGPSSTPPGPSNGATNEGGNVEGPLPSSGAADDSSAGGEGEAGSNEGGNESESESESESEGAAVSIDPDPKDQFILSCVILLYLLYPTLCKQVFRLFTCVDIGNKWYLSADLQVECFLGKHLTMVLLLGVPQLLVYIVGLPLLGFSIMYFSGEHRKHPKMKYRFGVLYAGYRPEMLYWEVFVALRKVLVSALVVLVSEIGVSMQIHLGMFVLMFALVAHLFAKPFVTKWALLDVFETGSLVICWLTLWSGIVYIQNDPAHEESRNDGSAQLRIDLTTSFIVIVNSLYLLASIIVVLHQKLVEDPSCGCGVFQRTKLGQLIVRCLSYVPLVEMSPTQLQPVKSRKSSQKNTSQMKQIEMNTLTNAIKVSTEESTAALTEELTEDSTAPNSALVRCVSMGGREWGEYVDATSGQAYYHSPTDGTTQWENPMNVMQGEYKSPYTSINEDI